jgi:hypothetical protein
MKLDIAKILRPQMIADPHIQDLAKSKIDQEAALAAGIGTVPPDMISKVLGTCNYGWALDKVDSLLAFPYPSLNGDGYFRVKVFPPIETKDGTTKYLQPAGSTNHLYLPPGVDPKGKDPLYVTEGEKKSLCLTLHGFPCIGLGGVYGWMQSGQPIPDLDGISWKHRDVIIVFDADIKVNDKVAQAERQLAQEFLSRKARVFILRLPYAPGCAKGADDYIVAHGVEAFKKLRPKPEKAKSQAKVKPDPESVPKSDYIAKLNERHAVIMIGGKCIVMNEVIDPVFNRPDITFSSVFDFKNFYSNIKTSVIRDGKPKDESVGKVWLESPERRQYAGIVFAPGQDIPGFYNLFRGFPVKPKKGDWSLFRDHIREIIADGNGEHFQYLLAWMSRLVQDPGGERAGVSIALRGEMGTGKGCFASQFGEIFGTHFLHITNPVHLVHRFNSHLKDCLLCFVDEGIWAGDKTAEGVLKGMITEKHIICEPKGKDAFLVKNHIHLIIASNSEWIVPAGFDERRFLVLDVSNRRKQDHEYFGAVFDQMDHGGREAMLYDLLEMKSDVDLRKVPRTGALLDQVICTMPTVHKFWFERLRAGMLLDEHREWEPYVITEKLFQAYLDFAANCGDRYRLIDRQFGREIRKLCPEAKRGRKVIDSRDKWVLYIPDLANCRESFENIVKVKVNWDAEVDDYDLPF